VQAPNISSTNTLKYPQWGGGKVENNSDICYHVSSIILIYNCTT